MALGSSFPPGFLNSQIERRLRPGAVVKLKYVMDDGVLQEKRFLVVSVESETVTFVINSEIGNYLKARPALLKCQVGMDVATHPFMTHDSHVDCSRARSYPKQQVIAQLIAEPSWVLGDITADLRSQVVAAIKSSPTLSPDQAYTLCLSLEAAVLV